MLELLRKGAQTWVAKILFGLLVISFGYFGANSSMMRGQNDSVLTVGNKAVSANEFRMAFQREVQALSRQFNTQLSTEQAKAFGAGARAMARLAAGAALDQLATDMKLGMSEGRLAQTIAEDPAFQDNNGVYSKELFFNRLRDAGIRPEDYIRDSQNVAVRIQIVDAASNGYQAPKALVDALTQYARESRAINYFILSNANIEPVKAPDDATLAKWYEDNKSRYRAPEYRKFHYVKLEPADIADLSSVTEDDVKADYERQKDKFKTLETRTIEQLTFADQASADAAAAKLAAGTTFDALVAEQGKTASDVLLGDFNKTNMPAATMADAAFAVTTDGGISAVTQGVVGPVIMRVSNIRPETVKTFDEVKEQLRTEIATAKAAEEIQNVYDRIEDLRASGSTIAEVAKQLKLKDVTIEAIDADGLDMTGTAVKDIPDAKLVGEVFKTEPGVEAIPLQQGDSGYVWFETAGVTPSRDRKIEEVKDKVVVDWTAEQQAANLAKKATELATHIKDGGKLEDVATELALAVETKSGLRRTSQDAVLSTAAISSAFGGPVGYVAAAEGTDKGTQILLQVTEVNPEATSEVLDNSDQQIQALARASGDDILDQMMTALQNQYGVTTNQTLADQAMVR